MKRMILWVRQHPYQAWLFTGLALILLLPAGIQAYGRLHAWKALIAIAPLEKQQQTVFLLPCMLEPVTDSEARAALRAALADYTHTSANFSLHRLAGEAYCQLGQYDLALRSLNAARALRPQDTFSALQVLSIYAHTQDHAGIEREIHAGTLTAVDLVAAADALLKAARWNDTLLWTRWAIQLEPTSETAWKTWQKVGAGYEAQKDWVSAFSTYREAIGLQEQMGVGAYRGSFYLKTASAVFQMDPPAAIDDYNRAIQDGRFFSENEFAQAYVARATWYRTFRAKYPLSLYLADGQTALAVAPQSASALMFLGYIYLSDLKDPAQAADYFQRGAEINPEEASFPYYQGLTLEAQGNLPGAEAQLQRALKLRPNWPDAMDALAAVRKKMNAAPSSK